MASKPKIFTVWIFTEKVCQPWSKAKKIPKDYAVYNLYGQYMAIIAERMEAEMDCCLILTFCMEVDCDVRDIYHSPRATSRE